jgi:hypothetical protein
MTIGFGDTGENKPWYIDRNRPMYWYLEGQEVIIVDVRGNMLEAYLDKADWETLYVYPPNADRKSSPNALNKEGIFIVGPKREYEQLELDFGEKNE